LQDISIDGARGVLVNISARQDTLTMAEVTQATTKIYEEVHEDANIILGVIFDDNLGEELRVTVIATGIRTVEGVEDVVEKVRPLLPKREAKAQNLPFKGRENGQREAVAANGGVAAGCQRRFPSILNEDEFDKPTFLRKNES
jgi:cell division protein FtsZ